jgi:hypothetical protein
MKTSVISEDFRTRYLSNPNDQGRVRRAAPSSSRGRRTITHRIDDPEACKIDETIRALVVRGVGPLGYPGSAEVVNMQPPAALLKKRHPRRCPASATAASPAPPARPRSSTLRPRRPRAAASRLLENRRPRAHRSSQTRTADILVS